MTLSRSLLLAAAAVSLAAAAPVRAGDGNELYIEQDSTGAGGNSALIDQSGASNSLVLGVEMDFVKQLAKFGSETPENNLNPDEEDPFDDSIMEGFPDFVRLGDADGATNPMLQRGERNEATLRIESGSDSQLQLRQDNSGGDGFDEGPVGNIANITANGSNVLGGVVQLGDDNIANLNIDGNDASGLIAQFGTDLQSRLEVNGPNTSGTVLQIGDNSNTGTVEVGDGVSLTYTQIGDNLEPIGDTGVNVNSFNVTDAVSITQTGF